MKVLINALNLRVGGGVTVVFNFLKTIIDKEEFHHHSFYVLAPPQVGYEEYEHYPVKVEITPMSKISPIKRLVTDHTWLKRKINEINPDVVFSMGNFAVPTNKKQAVLFMLPYAIYPEDKKVWGLLDLKTRFDFRLRNELFKSRLKYADVLFPQTKTSQKRLNKYYPNHIPRTIVIPTAYSRISSQMGKNHFFKKNENNIYLLCLTKYYKHKNVEIFIPLAKKLKHTNSNIRILTTVEGDQGVGSQEFIDSIVDSKLEDYIINIGKIPMTAVPSLYDKIDGLILPTLLESFSATYADSLTFKKPIFTSERDFARDVCGDAAFYFDPHKVDDIYNHIVDAFNHPEKIKKKIELGYSRITQLPTWDTVTATYINALQELCGE